MLTTGEAITTAYREINVGSETIETEVALRTRGQVNLTKVCKRIRSFAPYWWKHGDGTVALTNGVGTMPVDFEGFGTLGHPYIQGQETLGPLCYMDADMLEAHLKLDSAVSTVPRYYTLKDKTPLGVPKIKTYPRSNVTLALVGYVKRMPDLVDFPVAPTVTPGAAGLLNGPFRYRVTFKHPAGETEGGTVSAVVNPATQKVDLSAIPVAVGPAGRIVTARGIYRTEVGGEEFKFAQDVAGNVTTALVGEEADVSLGVACPTPATAVTGLEVFPDAFHETAIVDGLVELFARKAGDTAEVQFSREWVRDVRRMWANEKQGQNIPRGFPPYGAGALYSGYRRPRLMQ